MSATVSTPAPGGDQTHGRTGGHADVAVVLVTHDGARWLPAVLDGLEEQTAQPSCLVVVDTGSKDTSADLVEERLTARRWDGVVLRESGRTHFPAAVDLALARLTEVGDASEWVWLLHDDARPAPGALAALLAAAAERPDADLLGPKLREWPSLRRLLELGVTISGTGRRETGLEAGEYDQGQHDDVREVLAVNTAGLLVRRRVLEELGGLDERLPIFGNDVDLGWRAAIAGHTTLVVPQAVVFHAEAAHRGVRRTPLTGRHTHYQERRAALYTLLVNCRARALPFQVVRLALGTLLRMIGFLVVRSVGEALDELAALVSVYSRPGEVRAGRRRRARARSGSDRRRAGRLLAPPWLPYRHGLDFVGDLVAAATMQAADVAERRRAAAAEKEPAGPPRPRARPQPTAGAEAGTGGDPDDDLLPEPGPLARLITDPVAIALAVVVVALLVVARAAFGPVAGGGLSPAPTSVGDWWSLWARPWHALGVGTDVPAPPYVLPLALLGSLLGPDGAVTAALVLAAPLALWGGYRFLRVVARLASRDGAPRWAVLVGATTWALLPWLTGAWGSGRIGVVLGAAVLPWLAHAALGFADPEPDRRWRAGWRTGLLTTLLVALLPTAWAPAVALVAVCLVGAARLAPGALRDRDVWGPPAAALATVVVLLLPWWLPALVQGHPASLLLDTGRLPLPGPDGLDLLAGRYTDLAAPWWWGVVPLVLAAVALVPRGTRVPVLVCWLVGLVVAVVGALLALLSPGLPSGTQPAGLGVVVLLVPGVALAAAVIGSTALQGVSLRLRAAVLAVAALLPVAAAAWAVVGASDELGDAGDDGIPAYMTQAAEAAPEDGVLVLRGSVDDGFSYDLRRGDGLTLGEDEVLAATPEDTALTRLLTTLTSQPGSDAVDGLAAAGVRYVVMPAPADGEVAARLDATGGLTQASAETRTTRAWEVDADRDAGATADPTSTVTAVWRTALVVVQALGVLVVLVLCLPTIRGRRR